jgi:AcrR family transcriptional regulator
MQERTQEIKTEARRLLSAEGAHALSVRKVARNTGVTPTAFHRYYPGLGALVDDLRTDLCEELKLLVESAGDEVPEDDPFGRTRRMAVAFRAWALSHRSAFRLLFGPRSQRRVGAGDPSYEIGLVFLEEFAAICRRPESGRTAGERSGEFSECQVDQRVTVLYPDLSPRLVLAFLRVWATVCGLVMMEASGHMEWLAPNGQELFEIELTYQLDRLKQARLASNPGTGEARTRGRQSA